MGFGVGSGGGGGSRGFGMMGSRMGLGTKGAVRSVFGVRSILDAIALVQVELLKKAWTRLTEEMMRNGCILLGFHRETTGPRLQ